MDKIIIVRGRHIAVTLVEHAIRIVSNSELSDLLAADTESATDELVLMVKSEYHNAVGSAFSVSDASLAVEIWGHVYVDKFADIVKSLSPFAFIDGLADKVSRFTNVIDIGETGHDNNRFVWDALARFKSAIAVLLPRKTVRSTK